MKKNNIKINTIIIFLFVTLVAVFICLFIVKNDLKSKKVAIKQYSNNLYYQLVNYRDYLTKMNNLYIPNDKINENTDKKDPIDNNQIIDNEKPKENEPITNSSLEESIVVYSSLTATSGLISVSGSSKNVDVLYQGKSLNHGEGDFSFSAGTSYEIVIKTQKTSKRISITSPAYGTNKIISQLTLAVNPITMSASIIGQLNLLLPGEITGSLYNLSNSTSSSTILKKGYFSTSVPLQEGTNTLTATGQWLTIKLDLPSIQVIVKN